MSSSPQYKLRVLFVDDEQPIRDVMKIELPRMGHDVSLCENGEEAIESLSKNTYDVAIVDLRMPGKDGWDVIEHLKTVAPETEFIISTGHGDMSDAIQALRQGAYDFLPKPCKLFEIASVLQRVGEKLSLQNKTIALEKRLTAVAGCSDMVGQSPAMQRVYQLIDKIGPTDSAVMVLGETGTGKELVAKRIHDCSQRKDAPFVAINCGALPENLVESEFFGHRKGAFTGADAPRKGLFEVANGGTLFLDELGELSKAMQVKLLRFLESGEVRRVGENDPFHVDVRVVCATNKDLQDMVRDGSFREDLFFRINTFEIHLPPLRERKSDIPSLALHLVARHLKKADIPDSILAPETAEALMEYEWPGNVRELANAMEHAVILSDGQSIMTEDLPRSILSSKMGSSNGTISLKDHSKTLREIEMEVIYGALERNLGDKPKTARELGIALKTLYNKLNQYQSQYIAG